MALGYQRDAAEPSRKHLGLFRQAYFVGLGMVMQDGWRDYKKVGTTAEAELTKRIHKHYGKNPDRTFFLSRDYSIFTSLP